MRRPEAHTHFEITPPDDPNHEESFLFTGVLADSKVDMVTDGMMQDNSQFHEWHARKGDAAWKQFPHSNKSHTQPYLPRQQ